METFLKIFGVFIIIWIIWYLTGGPQRSSFSKPYVKYDMNTNTIIDSDENIKDGLIGQIMTPTTTIENMHDSLKKIGNNE